MMSEAVDAGDAAIGNAPFVIGGNVSIGLANGIDSEADKAIQAANSLAEGVTSILSSSLQVQSPSRLTRQIGEYVGEGLALGDERFSVQHTPGHTKGSVCFLFRKSRACFTGDTVFNVDLGRTDLEDGSFEEMCESILQVADHWAGDITIYPGHGDSCTMKTVRRINQEFIDIVAKAGR